MMNEKYVNDMAILTVKNMKNVFDSTIKKLTESVAGFQDLFDAEIIRVKNEKNKIIQIMNTLNKTSFSYMYQYEKFMNIVDNSSNIKIMLDSLKNTLSIIKSELKNIEEK